MSEFDRYANQYRTALDRSLAMSGETSAYFARHKAAYIARMLDAGNRKILDFGCGVGLLSSELARMRPNDCLHGFDVSLESLERVDVRLRAAGVFTSDLQELDTNYDLIVLANVMHHVPMDQREGMISDLARRLAAGGILLVIEHNPLNPATRWVVSQCEFDAGAVLLRPREVRGYAAGAGLSHRRLDYLLFFPRVVSILRKFEPALRWCPLGAQYAISAVRC
jgi:2-polyprenyl-3-methyl-5-hydroxy-6-metoxy-1,4-benzoquinol methylase